jgi:hypothetical protein
MRPNNAHAFVNGCFRATVGEGRLGRTSAFETEAPIL